MGRTGKTESASNLIRAIKNLLRIKNIQKKAEINKINGPTENLFESQYKSDSENIEADTSGLVVNLRSFDENRNESDIKIIKARIDVLSRSSSENSSYLGELKKADQNNPDIQFDIKNAEIKQQYYKKELHQLESFLKLFKNTNSESLQHEQPTLDFYRNSTFPIGKDEPIKFESSEVIIENIEKFIENGHKFSQNIPGAMVAVKKGIDTLVYNGETEKASQLLTRLGIKHHIANGNETLAQIGHAKLGKNFNMEELKLKNECIFYPANYNQSKEDFLYGNKIPFDGLIKKGHIVYY